MLNLINVFNTRYAKPQTQTEHCVSTCESAEVRCCNGRKSTTLGQTADRSRCVRLCSGRVFKTSSKPVEPRALWDKHTDLR